MASAALQSFRRTVTVTWRNEQEAAVKQLLLKTARDGHAEIMRRQGNPSFYAYANRPGNTNLESVILPGPIVFKYSSIREVVAYAMAELIKASPRKSDSNSYADSHLLFVNGQFEFEDALNKLKPTDEVMISNIVPYARKLEIGKTKSGRDFLVSVPNRIYQRIATKVKNKFGNVAYIKFDYTTLPHGEAYQKDNRKRTWLKNKKAWRTSHGADRLKGMAIRYPCIVISELK